MIPNLSRRNDDERHASFASDQAASASRERGQSEDDRDTRCRANEYDFPLAVAGTLAAHSAARGARRVQRYTAMDMSFSAVPLRHRRPVRPLCFPETEPEAEKLGETSRHLWLRTALWQLLMREVRRRHTVGSEQFIYFNARDPRRCSAPDVYAEVERRTP
jgi:hypothetical protein